VPVPFYLLIELQRKRGELKVTRTNATKLSHNSAPSRAL
jgi:hypothetical protein